MKLILGTAQFDPRYGDLIHGTFQQMGNSPDEMLATAKACGYDAVDTASAYGASETMVGESEWRGEVHTKLNPHLPPEKSLAESLFKLRRDHVDVLYIHDSRHFQSGGSPLVNQVHQLLGTSVAKLGASIYDVDEFEAAVSDPRVGVIQVPLNALDQRFAHDLLGKARAAGKAVYARSLLLRGALASGGSSTAPMAELAPFLTAFREACKDLGLSPEELSVRWCCSLSELSGVILGADAATQITQNAAYASVHDTRDLRSAVASLPQPPRELVDPRRW